MKGLAFAYDPDGYWVEIVKRGEGSGITNAFNISQTMFRIKDPVKSIPFYEACGLTLVRSSPHEGGKFTNFFMANLSAELKAQFKVSARARPPQQQRISAEVYAACDLLEAVGVGVGVGVGCTKKHKQHHQKANEHVCALADDDVRSIYVDDVIALQAEVGDKGTESPEAVAFVKNLFIPVLELCHNWGTEADDTFAHFSGNTARTGAGTDGRGFGHIGQSDNSCHAPPTENLPRGHCWIASSSLLSTHQWPLGAVAYRPLLLLMCALLMTSSHSEGFLVDDVYAACDVLEPLGFGFKKKPDEGGMKGLAFAYDPDGYWVEILKRGGM